MSPATAVIAVERYIGSCLISSSPPYVSPAYSVSKKDRIGAGAYRFPPTAPAPIRDFYRQPPPGHHQPGILHHQPPPWILPPPSPSNGIRRHSGKDDVRRSPKDVVSNNKEDPLNRSPLSRLAIHTQGAPLIQAQRQNGRKPSSNNNANKTKQHNSVGAGNTVNSKSALFTGPRVQPEETTNENCLPRIIKPRKRRKKDRKPALPTAAQEPSIVTLKPYTPLCQEFEDGPKEGVDDRPKNRQNDDAFPSSDDVPVHDSADVVNDADEEPHRCCCRYCDPAGSVWDSPTVPLPSSSDEWSTLQVSSEIITSPNGHRDIEIKFFSTAAPTSPPPTVVASSSAKSSISPPWP